MIIASVKPELLPQIRAALEGRLLELDGYETAAPLPACCSDAEAEEVLRKLMTRYRPGIARMDMPAEEIPRLLYAVERVASHAGWDDLRFVDGLNAVYEVWKSDFRSDARLVFLGIYRRTLKSLIGS